ncbi:T-box transcription factor TBX6L [Esox lucius]|uniref:T-box transcription factor TBX6L n=1 Tax=Esox lucius TaxID=8010 RepID=UPI00097325D8|nr:T-box transcription factor TBX6L [Esox lucius]XP_019903811.1 T-box transcription factor TBX6L [Esox lucius]
MGGYCIRRATLMKSQVQFPSSVCFWSISERDNNMSTVRSSKAMYMHEESPSCGDYPYPLNSQTKSYGCCLPDAVHRGQCKDSSRTVRDETEISDLEVRVSLQGRELWEQFRGIRTEMLITKTGRRMFPCCKVTVTGLNPRGMYVFMMDMVPFDENKYKWSTDHWEVSGMAEPHIPNRFFIHPDSPSLGKRWMQYPVSFHKLKLTNSTLNSNGLVVLHSMQKYQPRLHIVQSPDPHNPPLGGYLCFTLPQAAFIAVTAYQNSEITKLKIDNNPFAKGFRDNGLNRKRYREKQAQSSNKQNERHCLLESKSSNGATAVPFGQEGCGVQDPRIQNTLTHNIFTTMDYGSPGGQNEARHTGLSNVASPLVPGPFLGESHYLSTLGFRSLPAQSSGLVVHHTFPQADYQGQRCPAPHLSPIYSHTSGHQGQRHPQQADFDCPLPLPPKVSRMNIPESLEMSPSHSLSGCHRPLNDILNRNYGSAVHSGRPQGKLLQAHYDSRTGLGVDRELRQPQLDCSGCLPLHSMVLFHQNSLTGSLGPLRDGHVVPKVISSVKEHPNKAPLQEMFLDYQNVK